MCYQYFCTKDHQKNNCSQIKLGLLTCDNEGEHTPQGRVGVSVREYYIRKDL